MAWKINYSETSRKQLQKLDRPVARRIIDFMDERVAKRTDPRDLGKALGGPLGKLWRYRMGDYRLICDINDKSVTVLVIRIGQRREVYR